MSARDIAIGIHRELGARADHPGAVLLATYVGDADAAKTRAVALCERVEREPMRAALFGGVVGVAFTMTQVARAFPEIDIPDVCTAVDEAIETSFADGWEGPVDLIAGAIGIGVYALERCNESLMLRVLEAVERWTTDDNGVAHGIAGAIAWGSSVAFESKHEATRVRARNAVNGWVRELEYRARPGEPVFAARAGDARAARLAWCYGDAGIAVALQRASRALGDSGTRALADRVTLAAARRHATTTAVSDAGLCHGSAGLAVLFEALTTYTDDPRIREAAEYWRHDTLDRYRIDEPLGGYTAHAPDAAGVFRHVTDDSFLTGASGVALALIAPHGAWRRMLGVDQAR